MAERAAQPLSTPHDWLTRQYGDAAARMRKMILHPTGGTQAGQEFRRGRVAQQLNQIDKIVNSLKGDAARFVTGDLRASYMTGLKSAIQQARDAGIRPRLSRGMGDPPMNAPAASLFSGSFSLIDRRSIELLAKDTFSDFSKAADSMGKTATRILRQTGQLNLPERQINTILAGGIIDGTPVQTIRALRDELIRVNSGNMVEVNGRHYQAGYYAKMVATTKTREATETARSERLQELGIDLVMVIGRASNNFCSKFLSQVFSLSGKSDKYPALSSMPGGGPPFHPNCSKSTRAFVEELATPTQLREAQPTPDTRVMAGMNAGDAQRAYKDLQMRTPSEQRNRRSTESIGDSRYRTGTPDSLIKPRSAERGTGDPPVSLPESGMGNLPMSGDFITDREATDRLRPLGIASVSLAGRQDIGDVVIPHLETASRKIGVVPASVAVDKRFFEAHGPSSPLNFNAETKRLSINPAWPHWSRVAERVLENFNDGLWSSSDPLHMYYHELAHQKWAEKIGIDEYRKQRLRKFSKEDQSVIEHNLSKSAGLNRAEFISEALAAKAAGQKLHPKILAIYTTLEGP